MLRRAAQRGIRRDCNGQRDFVCGGAALGYCHACGHTADLAHRGRDLLRTAVSHYIANNGGSVRLTGGVGSKGDAFITQESDRSWLAISTRTAGRAIGYLVYTDNVSDICIVGYDAQRRTVADPAAVRWLDDQRSAGDRRVIASRGIILPNIRGVEPAQNFL